MLSASPHTDRDRSHLQSPLHHQSRRSGHKWSGKGSSCHRLISAACAGGDDIYTRCRQLRFDRMPQSCKSTTGKICIRLRGVIVRPTEIARLAVDGIVSVVSGDAAKNVFPCSVPCPLAATDHTDHPVFLLESDGFSRARPECSFLLESNPDKSPAPDCMDSASHNIEESLPSHRKAAVLPMIPGSPRCCCRPG